MLSHWKKSLIYPMFKKGDKCLYENYRGISQLGVAYKVFSSIIVRRLHSFSENTLQEYQCGFLQGRGTIDQIFGMIYVMGK